MLRYFQASEDEKLIAKCNNEIKSLIKKDAELITLSAAYLRRGNLHAAMHHFNEAIADYTKAMEFNKERNHKILRLRGMAFYNAKKYTEAIDDFTNAIACMPVKYKERSAVCFYWRGMAKDNLNYYKKSEVIDDFKEAVSLNSDKQLILQCYRDNRTQHSHEVLKYLAQVLKEFFSKPAKVKPAVVEQRVPAVVAVAPNRVPFVAPQPVYQQHSAQNQFFAPSRPVAVPAPAPVSQQTYVDTSTPLYKKMGYEYEYEYRQDAYKAWKSGNM